jgi:hypothetical protein
MSRKLWTTLNIPGKADIETQWRFLPVNVKSWHRRYTPRNGQNSLTAIDIDSF